MLRDALRFLNPFARRDPAPLVTVLRLEGVIRRAGPLRGGIDAAQLEPLIARAFAPKRLAAVALIVNSPGGSPVQSSLICARIRAAAAEREVPVLAFAEDVAASGGYWLALAGDEIFADPSSIVGSIGVVFRSFGLVDAIAKLGIERRVHASGARKSALDPFQPEAPEDAAMLEAVQVDVFDAFKDAVRERRGERLKGAEEELFSGAFWSARRALALGLIDGFGDVRTVLRARFGPHVRLREMTRRRSWLARRLGGAGSAPLGAGFAGGFAEGLAATAEDRALWGRFGL